MDNNDNKPYVQEYPAMELLSEKARERIRQADIDQEQAEVGASVRRMQRERMSVEFMGRTVEVPGAMREQFVQTPEAAASRAAERLKAMFAGKEELADSRDKEANEYMGTMGSISARQRQITAQALENCAKDKDGNPLVCYGCRNSVHGTSFPGGPSSHKPECASCTRYAFARSLDEEQLKRMDRYIADDILEEAWESWKKEMLPAIKREVKQDMLDELAKEAQVMSPNKINRIILRKH